MAQQANDGNLERHPERDPLLAGSAAIGAGFEASDERRDKHARNVSVATSVVQEKFESLMQNK